MAALVQIAYAQDAPIVVVRPIAVGAITRDAGIYVVPKDVATIRSVNQFLITVESDLAAKVSSMRGLSYQDRTATAALLNEVHMSLGPDFDRNSGALHGLMGRLDYLIVIDALDRSTAKMRLIDVETGSVKGVGTCTRGAAGNASCVAAMAHRLEGLKGAAADTNANLMAARQDVMKIKPHWDDQVARWEAAHAYWAKIQSEIGPAGHTLRPEIQTLLNGAQKDEDSGKFAVEHLDAPNLKVALDTLTVKLDKLDALR
jgi:hypothetical protein